jgi:hypothetical protein
MTTKEPMSFSDMICMAKAKLSSGVTVIRL